LPIADCSCSPAELDGSSLMSLLMPLIPKAPMRRQR
jgi:hypothetical protein